MNITGKFSYNNTSTAGEVSSAVESSYEIGRRATHTEKEIYGEKCSVSELLSEWREDYHGQRRCACTELCLTAKELLTETFLHDKESAFFMFDEICNWLYSYSPTVKIDLYARGEKLFFEFFSDVSTKNEKNIQDCGSLYELVLLCESRGSALTVEEDMTGSMHLAVSFDHIDIGTVGFKTTPRIVRGDAASEE